MRKVQERHTEKICIHPFYGFISKPNSRIDYSEFVDPSFGHGSIAETNRHGFRFLELPEQKPNNEFWIGLFGGSVAFSLGSSEEQFTISHLLEKKLIRILKI